MNISFFSFWIFGLVQEKSCNQLLSRSRIINVSAVTLVYCFDLGVFFLSNVIVACLPSFFLCIIVQFSLAHIGYP